jgi:hypothetical protein
MRKIGGPVPTSISNLPQFLVLEPHAAVRVEFTIRQPACEIDVRLENPAPGRSVIVLIGQLSGGFVQRVRIAGRAELYFEPQLRGAYALVLSNPMGRPAVVHLAGRNVPDLESFLSRRRTRASSARHRDIGGIEPRVGQGGRPHLARRRPARRPRKVASGPPKEV